MSISFSGTTLTFSDSTTMTTAAVAGPPGPTGPSGSTGPTGPTGAAGTNASVVTTYGAVGTYVIAYGGNYTGTSAYIDTSAGCTVAGACLLRTKDSCNSFTSVALNATAYCSVGNMLGASFGCSSRIALGLSGTWRTMTNSRSKQTTVGLNLFVRVS